MIVEAKSQRYLERYEKNFSREKKGFLIFLIYKTDFFARGISPENQ